MNIGEGDFRRQVGIGSLGKVASAIISFAGSVLVARVLGPELFGTFFFLFSIVSLLDNPVSGWAIACRKRYTEQDAEKGQIASAMLLAALSSTSLVLAGGAFLSVLDFVNRPTLYATFFLGTSSFIVANNLVLGTSDFGLGTWLNAGRDVFRVILQVSLVLLGFGVGGMVVGITIANLLILLIAFRLAVSTLELPSQETIRNIASFGKFSIPRSFVGYGRGRFVTLLIGVLAMPELVGKYEVLTNILLPMLFLSDVISGGLLGQISHLHSQNESIHENVENAISFTSLLAIPIAIGAFIIGRELVVTVYGPEYAVGSLIVGILALAKAFQSQSSIFQTALSGVDEPRQNLINMVLSTATLLIGSVALYHAYGFIGIVVGVLLSDLVWYVASVVSLRRVENVSVVTPLLLRQLGSGVVMAIVVYALEQRVPVSSVFNLLLIVGIGGIVYFALLLTIAQTFRDTVLEGIKSV